MHTLKEVQEGDLNLFFNTDEIAEDASINGIPCIIIMKPHTLKQLKIKMGESLIKAEVMFEVKKSQLTKKPRVNGRMQFNDETYNVLSCSDNRLTYEIILEGFL